MSFEQAIALILVFYRDKDKAWAEYHLQQAYDNALVPTDWSKPTYDALLKAEFGIEVILRPARGCAVYSGF